MWKVIAFTTVLAACGAKLAEDGTTKTGVDAGAPASSDADATVDPLIDASIPVTPDAPPAPSRVVYLNFVGANLHKGTPSDAKTNTVSWMYQATSGTAPAYGGSQTDLDTIRDGVKARLSGIATVVVSRPTSGEYVMVVYGGTAANVHSFYGVAVSQLDCGDTVKSDVAWIAGNVNPTDAIDTTMGAIGFGLGLSASQTTDDCMCSWGNNCTPSASACVLRDGVLRDTAVGNDPNLGTKLTCPGARQDELATFTAAFQ